MIFKDWQISAPQDVIARQYDNLSRTLQVTGELPEEYSWDLLIQAGKAMDIIPLSPMEGGVGVTLTADQLSQSGYYQMQLRGTRGEEVRHTNVITVFIPASLSGSGQWPVVPSEFTALEARMREIAAHPPVPAGSGYWQVWDPESHSYVDSEFPLSEVSQVLSIGTVETLEAGSDATASLSGTAENLVLNLGIPRGADGGAGETIPEYVQAGADAAAKTVLSRQTDQSFCLAFLSDMHCGAEYEVDGKWIVDDTSVLRAGQALSALAKTCPFDAIVFGGDFSIGSYKTTGSQALVRMDDSIRYMADGAVTAPSLYLNGNHDDAPYMATADRLTRQALFVRLGRKDLLSGAVLDRNNPSGIYGYLDFEAQKMRVIFLDTDDKPGWESTQVGASQTNNYLDACNITGEQLSWLANTALDFSGKPDAAEWGIIVCSHRSLNSAGGTYTDATSGASYPYDVSNAVTILDAYLSGGSGSMTHNGVTVNYNFSAVTGRAALYCCIHGHDHAYRFDTLGTNAVPNIGCPNVLNGMERVSDDGTIYTKTPGTAEDTAFCIITVDRRNNVIYADHYGAGYDRQWEYTPLPESGGYTNQIPISTDTDGSIYNGVGYKAGYRLGSSGAETVHGGMYLTGFIPCAYGDVIRLKNVTFNSAASDAANQRISFYDGNKTHLVQSHAASTTLQERVYDENNNLVQLTVVNFVINSVEYDLTNVAYFRLNGSYIGEDSVITVNEPIE